MAFWVGQTWFPKKPDIFATAPLCREPSLGYMKGVIKTWSRDLSVLLQQMPLHAWRQTIDSAHKFTGQHDFVSHCLFRLNAKSVYVILSTWNHWKRTKTSNAANEMTFFSCILNWRERLKCWATKFVTNSCTFDILVLASVMIAHLFI